MLLEEMMRKEREEGILTGRKEEKAECVLAVLGMKGAVAPELRNRIESESDMDKLSKWLLPVSYTHLLGLFSVT